MSVKYHVALSFAGEDRNYVEQVAVHLRAAAVAVFYDKFEEAELWGKNLYEYLSDLYQNKALFTVMFVSQSYASKTWTNHERRSAQARALTENREYILPAKFDDSIEIPGLLTTTQYVSLKKKTPEELAELIVQKLKKSGVKLSEDFSYSDEAKADVDFAIPAGKIGGILRAMKSYTWGTQSPAVNELLEGFDWTKVSDDQAFVLGRNLYQCSCGNERKAVAALGHLRRTLADLPPDRASHLLNGMFYEVYFNSEGEFRGARLKARCLNELLAIQSVKKYAASIGFIRSALEPYKTRLFFRPSTVPEIVRLDLGAKLTDPPTAKSLKCGSRNLLTSDPDNKDYDGRLWRLSFQGFTLKELEQHVASEWGIPPDQLEVRCEPAIDAKTKIRLAEGTSIIWPTTV